MYLLYVIAVDGKKALKDTHYLHDEFSDHSLNNLLDLREEIPFHDQVVMCIDQEGIYRKSSSRPKNDPFLVNGMVIFGRNVENGQIYRLKRLQASLHFSKS